jgi:asparagine synthase (glutamine-hydrolysing)
MCGIAGFYSFNQSLSIADLEDITSTVKHRGPNATNTFYDEVSKVGLGHTRLSIIDLRSSSNQPMTSQCGRYVIVFNGEIYNFKELRKEIKGVAFRTNSDTEVLLEGFANFGQSFVDKLVGMFAFVIYDKAQNKLMVCRDRVGLKPIYYYNDNDNFIFGSELKVLEAVKVLKGNLQVNRHAVLEYLHFGYVPEPFSIYENVYKFPSGNIWDIDGSGEISKKTYWDINSFITKGVVNNETEVKTKVKELIDKSVNYRLVSDVPSGIFLSSGTDSSLIAAAAAKVSSYKIDTFTIGFTDKKQDESLFASKIANYIGTNHHTITAKEKDALELFDHLIDVYDEPFADSSAIPTMLVSKLAKDYVTMALSGDGGDELFMGYGNYIWANRLRSPFIYNTRHFLAFLVKLLGNRYRDASQRLKYNSSGAFNSHVTSYNNFTFDEINRNLSLLNSSLVYHNKVHDHDLDLGRELSPAESLALFNIKHYLKDNLLVKTDRASMYYALEVREPLLDHKLIEYALNIDETLKLKGKDFKYVLKQVLLDYLPKEFVDRKKQGFSIPLARWLRSDLNYLLDKYLSREIIEKYNYVSFEYTDNIIRQFNKGADYLAGRIWILIILHKWLLAKIK